MHVAHSCSRNYIRLSGHYQHIPLFLLPFRQGRKESFCWSESERRTGGFSKAERIRKEIEEANGYRVGHLDILHNFHSPSCFLRLYPNLYSHETQGLAR